jgi:hypothetical protein
MHTLRTIGIVGTVVLLFSATAVFAQGQPENSGMKANQDSVAISSTTIANIKEIERVHMAAASTTRQSIQAVREEAQTRIQTMRGEAEKRLADIQDKVKQQQAQSLAQQFENINTSWTDKFVQTLNQYDAILQKVQDRANIAATDGKDITATTATILVANNAIASARLAVVAQVAKTYTLATSTVATVTTATTTPKGQGELIKALRTSFNSLHQTLFKDLFALRDGPMATTRKAVQVAIQTLGKIPGVDGGQATSTATTTNQ